MRRSQALLLAVLSFGPTASCTEERILTPPPPPPPPPSAPATKATLIVNTITTGSNPDGNGYLLTMDGEDLARLAATEEREFTIDPGRHEFQLTDLAANCLPIGANPRSDVFVPGQRGAMTFQLDCPAFSSVDIVITTSGSSLDSDGYTLSVGGVVLQHVEPVDQVQLTDIRSGFYTFQLSLVAGNCTVIGGSALVVFFREGEHKTVTFDVRCGPRADEIPGEKLVLSSREPFGGTAHLEIVNLDGSGRQRLTDNSFDEQWPEFSPDGSRILYLTWSTTNSTRSIMILDRVLRTSTVLPTERVDRAVWSPDGSRIAFVRNGRLYLMNADGSGESELTNGFSDSDPYWSPDGNRIAFTRADRVYVVNVNGSGPQAVGPANRKAGPWSPDGQKILATTLVCTYYYWYCYYGLSAADLVILHVADGSETPVTTSLFIPEWSPVWSSDGTQIYFISMSTTSGNSDVFRIGANGQGLINVTNSGDREEWLTRGVIPPSATALRTARPKP